MSWNDLSMAERARMIAIGVSNGVINLDHIKEAYNKYTDGGIILPELVVTPRMSYINYTGEETDIPTLEQYKQARRDEIRAKALLDMQNTTKPTVPSLPSTLGRLFRRVAGDWYDDEDAKFIFGTDNNPNTCLSTVTSKYGRTVSGNKTFSDNHKNYGFIEIPENERNHGDIVQTIGRRGVPGHAAMVSGFTRDGNMLIDESHGGVTPETIEHDVDYFDTRPELKRKKYYRFVGNEEDNNLWEREYNRKYNRFDEGGPKRIITTGNEYVDIAANFVPFVGTAMDWETAIREPSIANYAWALGSTAIDLVGGSLIKGAAKTYKAYKAFKAADKLNEAADAARRGAERAYRAGKSKKAKMLTRDAANLEARAKSLRGDTRIFNMGDTPSFYDALRTPIITNIVGSAYNGAQLGMDALYDMEYPNSEE